MKKLFTTLVVSMQLGLVLYGQNPVVTVLDTVQNDNSVVLSVKTTGYGNFTIRLNISDISNCAEDISGLPKTYTVSGNTTTRLAVLHPQDVSQPVVIRYGWDWLQGRMDAVPDSNISYELPLCTKRQKVRELTAHEMKMDRTNVVDFKMWEMSAKNAVEAVCAMRCGTVIAAGDNSITIEHSDGTQAVYEGLEAIYVQAGEDVRTEDIIGLSNGPVTIGIYRYATNSNQLRNPQAMSQKEYLDVMFRTKKGNVILIDGKVYKRNISCRYLRQVRKLRLTAHTNTKNE